MIGYLKGRVVDVFEGKLLLAVGAGADAGFVGYNVTVPQSHQYGSLGGGKTVELFIHTHVREDALDLYGFCSKQEKDLFITLLSVNGIGPKAAINILSGMEPSVLVDAIIGKDRDALVRIPGIGKKTSERLVLELAEPLKKKVEAGLLARWVDSHQKSDTEKEFLREAREALLALGYSENQVNGTLNHVVADITASRAGQVGQAGQVGVEQVVRSALKHLSSGRGLV